MEKKKMLIKCASLLLIASMSVLCSFSNNNVKAATTTGSTIIPTNPPGGNPPGGGGGAVVTGTGAYTQSGGSVTKYDQSINSSNSNKSVVKVSKSGVFKLYNSTLIKTGGDTTSEDSSNFYGLNAGVLAEDGSQLTLDNDNISTSADGANAVFSTGVNSVINFTNSTISTTENSSRGLDATQGGTINAQNIKVTTKGAHCAAFATDRGGGNVNVKNAVASTSGEGSPAVYSTGAISVSDSSLNSTGSEAAVIEGKNSITLTNTSISGAVNRGIMLYQSTSGDSEVGTSVFNMTNGSLTAAVGPLFYCTNTDTIINLKSAKLSQSSGILLDAEAGRWGTSGSNGSTVAFNADSETLKGIIIADSISSATIKLTNNTDFIGAINTSNKLTNVAVNLDKTSTWNVTRTSYIGALTDEDSTLANINDNGNTIYYNSSLTSNNWLQSKTYTLVNGGKLTPITSVISTK